MKVELEVIKQLINQLNITANINTTNKHKVLQIEMFLKCFKSKIQKQFLLIKVLIIHSLNIYRASCTTMAKLSKI